MLPELYGDAGTIRIPELRNVPLTRRLVEIVDHPAFQRLRTVRQLGPTHLVYPGAVHARFEHSLGVFDMARQYLLSLLRDPHVADSLTEADIVCCLLAALLHDLGHYPFAHSLEALHHKGADTPRHEDLSGRILRGDVDALRGERPIGDHIRDAFGVDPEDVVAMITQKPGTHARPERRLVASVISSGVDADKADYLERDSIHMGVSYGRNYDRARFLDSLCANLDGDRIAVTEKGRVSAEIFIFTRYTMFSEAYWHHTVRAASAMIERALADYQRRESPTVDDLTAVLLARSDDEFLRWLVDRSPPTSLTHRLLSAMSGGRRAFYKRVLTLNRAWDDVRQQTAYERIYHLDADDTERLKVALCERLSALLDLAVEPDDVIIDTPPRDKDRVESVDVIFGRGSRRVSRPLHMISKVVQGIGTDFIKVVKKIRVFVAPHVRARIVETDARDAVTEGLLDAILGFAPGPEPQQSLFGAAD